MMRFAWMAALGAVLLSGCATIPEDQCAKTDWYELGIKDGRAGYTADRLVQHRDACARAKVEPDETKYLQGRKAGLAEYCQPDNAIRDGLAGQDYRGVCDATFARNYRAAYRVFTLKTDIDGNRGAVSTREAEIRSDKTSDSRRTQLRSEIRELDRKRETLRDDLASAERELDRVRAMPPVGADAAPPTAAPAVPTRPPVTVGKPGGAGGKLYVGTTEIPLFLAYTIVAPDPLDNQKPRPMVLLTSALIPEEQIAQAPDLDHLLRMVPAYVLVIRNDAKPPKTTMIVWHPQLSAAIVEKDAGKSGVAKFDAYGDTRIKGTLASPQSGKAPYSWNKNLRLYVTFDAPLVRRWP